MPPVTIVDVGGFAVSNDPAAVLATYALGSCVGVAAYDYRAHVGGLLHVQLPDSALDPARAARDPGVFADTGVRALLHAMQRLGARERSTAVRLAGAAQLLGDRTLFDIGRKNLAAVRASLARYRMFPTAEDVGGPLPRTVYLHLCDGHFRLRTTPRSEAA